MATPIREISVTDFAARLAMAGGGYPQDLPQLIDVREAEELAIVRLPGFIHLPLSQFGHWGPELQRHLNPHQETYVLCHHGVRSAQMCHWLKQQGFTKVNNIAGGIHAYAQQVDRTMPRY
jgi:rhodanese-related sulfurtransferase